MLRSNSKQASTFNKKKEKEKEKRSTQLLMFKVTADGPPLLQNAPLLGEMWHVWPVTLLQCVLLLRGHRNKETTTTTFFFCFFLVRFAKGRAHRRRSKAKWIMLSGLGHTFNGFCFFFFFFFTCWTLWTSPEQQAFSVPAVVTVPIWRPRWTVDYNIDSKKGCIYIFGKSHLLFECLSVCLLSISPSL